MLRKTGYSIGIVFFLLLPNLSPRLLGEGRPSVWYGSRFSQADSLYQSGRFNQAYRVYQNLPLNSIPAARFRMAYAAYKAGRFEQSASLFNFLAGQQHFLTPYSRYFYIKSLWKVNPEKAIKPTITYIKYYRKHALADSLLIPVADYLFGRKKYLQAADFYTQAAKKPATISRKVYAFIQTVKGLYLSGRKRKAEALFLSVLKKYPSDKQTLTALGWVKERHPSFLQKHIFTIVKVYFKNKHYRTAKAVLEKFIRSHPAVAQKEKARFMLLTDWYYLGNFRAALYGLKKFNISKKNKNLQAQTLLFIARCYRKLGLVSKAIQTYRVFADQFPKQKKAAEALWKAAWLYEGKGNLLQAETLYHQLHRRWPKSGFAPEARFREGLAFFQQDSFAKAEDVFKQIRGAAKSDFIRHRAQYWAALCQQRSGNPVLAKRLRSEIAVNLWDDYYTMRSYLWHKAELDSTLPAVLNFKRSTNPLLYYANSIPHLLTDFEKALQVQELLGNRYSLIVLDSLKPALNSLQEWIALAEIYKKFNLYGKAYQTYDFINRRYFSDLSYVQKAFMLKERFPLYFDALAGRYSKRYALEKELVLAVIKRESAFRTQARSYADAYGLMQLIPPTANDMAALAGMQHWQIRQLFDADFNIHLGTLYLKQLSRRFKGCKAYMLAAYNAGPHRVERWLKKPAAADMDLFIENIEFQETRDYVRHVLKNYWAYKILDSNFTVKAEQLLSVKMD